MALESDRCKIACEISVSTGTPHEFANLAKGLSAGFDFAVLISADRKFVVRSEREAAEVFNPEELARIKFLTPEGLLTFLDEIAAAGQTKEGVVRGYNVRTKYGSTADEDRKNRERIITEVISKSLKGLK